MSLGRSYLIGDRWPVPREFYVLDGRPEYIGTDRLCPTGRVFVSPKFVVWHPSADVGAITAMLGAVAARNMAEAHRPAGVP